MYKKSTFETKIGCVIMASGKSRRFGENKLLAEFAGKSLIQTVVDLTSKNFTDGDLSYKNVSDEETINHDLTGMELFTKRLVLTRTREVEEICKKQNVPVIYHELQKRNEAIRLGIEEMQDMDGVLFCPCDQPLLKQSSLQNMITQFRENFEVGNKDVILRLCYGEKIGAPVLFGKGNFMELMNLPEGYGGSWICKQYPGRVRMVQAENLLELFDIDTKEELEYLLKKSDKM